MKRPVLLVDAAVNLALGVLLLMFTRGLVRELGVPAAPRFYPNVLGAVFIGIAGALALEYFRKPGGLVGIGVGGAVSINTCGAIVLAVHLIWGEPGMPTRGYILLWSLVAVLIAVSAVELVATLGSRRSP